MHKINHNKAEVNDGTVNISTRKTLEKIKFCTNDMIKAVLSKRIASYISLGMTMLSLAIPSTVHAGERTAAEAFSAKLGTGNNFMAQKVVLGNAAPEDAALLAKHHFNHCRIGAKFNDWVGSAPSYTIDAAKMADFKQAIDWCLAEGLAAIVNPVHDWAATPEHTYADTEQDKYSRIWEQVAVKFANYPLDTVAFELLNEPRTGYSLADIISNGLTSIRNTAGNKKRIVIVSGQGFSTRQALINAFDDNIIPADDKYLIGTFHYYDPKSFTKQGDAGNVNWADGGDADTEFDVTSTAFDAVVLANQNWAAANATDPLPIFLGEYGVDNGAPSADRLRWLSWIHLMAEERGFSTSHWNMYNDNPAAKGIGPWTTLEKNDPSMRYFHADPVEAIHMRYEVEEGILAGGVAINSTVSEFTGSGYVIYPAASIGSSVSATIDSVYIPRGDNYSVKVSYASDIARDMTINTFNDLGAVVQSKTVTFPSTGSFSTWGELDISIDFAAGTAAKIQLVADTVSGPNIDWIDVTRALDLPTTSGGDSSIFSVVADASVKQDVPNTNLGTKTFLQARTEGASNFARIPYLKFSVNTLAAAVNTATLYVYSQNEVDTVNALSVTDNSWGESTLTWNNRPAVGSIIGSAQATARNWFAIDVTSYITGNGTYSIALNELGDSYHKLGSKEGGFAAYLEIDTVAAPTNNLPVFTSDPVIEVDATQDIAYIRSVADNATDADGDPLTFLTVTGPAWLSVAADGTISGTPTSADVGENSWSLVVEDNQGGSSSAMLNIQVNAIPSTPIKIFCDDFESGSLSAWKISGTYGQAETSAAFEGSYGVTLKKRSRIKTTISTIGHQAATLSFMTKTKGLDPKELLKVTYSIDNGKTFKTLGETKITEWQALSFELPSDALGQAAVIIRFILKANKYNEIAFIDNVVISEN